MQSQSLVYRALSLFTKPTPVIGAIMKRETPYIVEWVAWHRLQGFDLIIADNCKEGPQTELLLKLAEAGIVHYIDFRHVEVSPQLPAYREIIHYALRGGYRYLGFMDADEFFEPLTENGLGGADLVAGQLGQRRVKCVSFRWSVFGSNGQENFGDELVVERFTRRGRSEERLNQYVKSFARLSSIYVPFLLTPKRVVTDSHTFQVSKRRCWLDGRRGMRMELGDRPPDWNLARIRHFPVKSKEEFSRKLDRGPVLFLPGESPRILTYWDDYDLNDTYDPIDPKLIDMLKDSIKGLYKTIL